jgi:hypothetical protein
MIIFTLRIIVRINKSHMVDIRSRANTTMGLDFEHLIKALAHRGGVRIGKTPKKF